ncbi:MAG: TRAP transporter small permease subunit [Burkholderiaceae bacterium]
MNELERIRRLVGRSSALLLGLACAALVVLEASQAVLRHGFAAGVIWVSDVSILLLLSLGWIGAGHLWITREHLVLDLFGKTPNAMQRPLSIATDILALAGIVWLTPRLNESIDAFSGITMGLTEIPASWRFAPVVVGLTLLALGSVLGLLGQVLSALSEHSRRGA